MKNIIFIAPPSAGKGTQSEMLVSEYGYTHISTGDLLRAGRDDGTPRAQEIIKYQDSGGLVPDEIVNELLRESLSNSKNSFILDGYPRNEKQCETLDKLFAELNIHDYVVLYLDIAEQTAMERALGRVTCPNCNAIYNLYYEKMKPKVSGICDECNTEIISRNDDNEETFKKRFTTYVDNINPVIEFYKNKGVLKNITVEEEKENTYKNIKEALND